MSLPIKIIIIIIIMSLKMLVNLLVKSLDNWYGTHLLFFLFFSKGLGNWRMGNGSHLSVSVYHLYSTFSFSKKKKYCTFHALNIENVKKCRHSIWNYRCVHKV